jgi:hypothetical protein
MREQGSTGFHRLSPATLASRRRTPRSPDMGQPPVARLGSRVGMPKAIFTEDDGTTVADIARIGRQAQPMQRRGKQFGS